MLNAKDLKDGCRLLFSMELEKRRYELGYMPHGEAPYLTWEVVCAKPTEQYMRSRFYSMDAALHDLERRIVSAVQERITGFSYQDGVRIHGRNPER